MTKRKFKGISHLVLSLPNYSKNDWPPITNYDPLVITLVICIVYLVKYSEDLMNFLRKLIRFLLKNIDQDYLWVPGSLQVLDLWVQVLVCRYSHGSKSGQNKLADLWFRSRWSMSRLVSSLTRLTCVLWTTYGAVHFDTAKSEQCL